MRVLSRESWYFPCLAGQVLRNPVVVIRPEVPVSSSKIHGVAYRARLDVSVLSNSLSFPP